MGETLTGTITRAVTMVDREAPARLGPKVRRVPAGTVVHAAALRSGGLRVRLPGTLFAQEVEADAVAPC